MLVTIYSTDHVLSCYVCACLHLGGLKQMHISIINVWGISTLTNHLHLPLPISMKRKLTRPVRDRGKNKDVLPKLGLKSVKLVLTEHSY